MNGTSSAGLHLLLLAAATCCVLPRTDAKGCTAVPLSQCGKDFYNSCLKCGTKSAYDCEKCCPKCTLVNKGGYTYCECGAGPSPAPGPQPGGDTWSNYAVDGMNVTAVTGGKDASNYDKVVIMLHGGGASSAEWVYNYQQGWFGNISGFKYVFPTSALEGHVWYVSYKNGCGLADDCAYNLSSIQDSASRVAALIEHEKGLVGGDATKVYLAGFSEGAQLTAYMQLAELDFALGGIVVMDGYPLPPLCDMPGHSSPAAKKNASYYGQDMNWMIWHGGSDQIFPVDLTMTAYHDIFSVLGITSTLKIDHVEPGQYHTVIEKEIEQMVAFIKGG